MGDDYRDFDLDDILAEFSGAETPSAGASSAGKHEAPAPPRPRAAARARSAVSAPRPSRVEEPTVLRPALKSPLRQRGKTPPAPPRELKTPEARRERPQSKGIRELSGLLSKALMLLSALLLLWLGAHLRPGAASGAPLREDLPARLDVYAANALAAAIGDTASLPKLHAIAENAVVAPAPDPGRFGSTTELEQVQAVIELAAPLLDGQSLAFDPEAQFMPGSRFQYYLDDSLFVLCWKEIIDDKCCSCAEIKMVDGSQIRRKLAGDSYGSSVQLYASQLAQDAQAVVAINGDFYTHRQIGLTVYQRQLYRSGSTLDTCFITAGGDMRFAYAGQLKTEAEAKQYIEENDVLFSLSFGPVLVDEGELKAVPKNYPVGEVDHYYSRSSLGQLDELHYLLMTVNFEGDYQHTCTIAQSGEFMQRKGCRMAYALDGGQTSVIVFNGAPYNRVDWNSERSMSDVLYFASAVHREEVTP